LGAKVPYFSLIIATLNRVEHNICLLTSLKEQTFKDFEVIIVDQNSHDNLKDGLMNDLQDFDSIYLHVKKDMGLSAARNYGLNHASGQVVAFPDDDCWYQKDSLQLVYDYLQRDSNIKMCPPVWLQT
jgi:glycosyltransferase involved in cell wall biosynthesis